VSVEVEPDEGEKLQEALKKVKTVRPGMEYRMLEICAYKISGCQELYLDQVLREVKKKPKLVSQIILALEELYPTMSRTCDRPDTAPIDFRVPSLLYSAVYFIGSQSYFCM
jgi:hypothetical protein